MNYALNPVHSFPQKQTGEEFTPDLNVYEIEPAVWGRVGPTCGCSPRSTQPEGRMHYIFIITHNSETHLVTKTHSPTGDLEEGVPTPERTAGLSQDAKSYEKWWSPGLKE